MCMSSMPASVNAADLKVLNPSIGRDCRKFWGASVNEVFPRLCFDREWTRGLGFEVGEDRR
jgi:hypothetical protein